MRLRSILLVLAVWCAQSALADEGLWTVDHFPKDAVRQKFGFDATDAWLAKLQHATVRTEDGCTGSFISSQGLVLTNQHCISSCLADLSDQTHDYMANGFLASTVREEKKCPGQIFSSLVAIEEITPRVEAATRGLPVAQANSARKSTLSRLESECVKASRADSNTGPLACEAVSLYQGGQYFLYKYRRYDDVRTVFAPHDAIAEFGGDPDNFNFPRWGLDIAIVRVYANGKPGATPDYLQWRLAGPDPGELVFVPGHPGKTDRLFTVAQLEFQRDTYVPAFLVRSSELRGRLIQWGKTGDEPRRLVQEPLQYNENMIKLFRGWQRALLDDELFSQKRAEEAKLRAAVSQNPALAREVGDAWGDVERAEDRYREIFDRFTYLESGVGFQSSLFWYAHLLVRAASERERPNELRMREFADSNLPKMSAHILEEMPIYPEYEKVTLSFSLEKLREWLGPDDPLVRRLLANDSPDTLAAKLIDESKLADPTLRKSLWDGGSAAIAASQDPMIVLAREIDPEARALRKIYEDQVQAPLAEAQERIARARFKILGTSTYPDATFTFRINYGTVTGWREKGEDVQPFTYLDRLYRRATGSPPFELPKVWLDARTKLDPHTPFNFTSTNDIIGGNSGSPLIDAKGQVIGAVFDGNIHSLGGDYGYDGTINRAVSVSTAAITEALSKVYGADALARELVGGT
jgi:hypothetical protein